MINNTTDLQISPNASGASVDNLRQIAAGDDISVFNLGVGPSADAMREGSIDAFFFTAIAPIDSEHYAFLIEPVQTVTVYAQLVMSVDMDEQIVYDIVRAIIENRDTIIEGHRVGTYIGAEHAVEYVSAPLHPGAIRFFHGIDVLD